MPEYFVLYFKYSEPEDILKTYPSVLCYSKSSLRFINRELCAVYLWMRAEG